MDTVLLHHPSNLFYPLFLSELCRTEQSFSLLLSSITSLATELLTLDLSGFTRFKAKRLLTAVYHDLMRLESFRSLNITAVSKILKKANTKFRHLLVEITVSEGSSPPAVLVTSSPDPTLPLLGNFSKHLLNLISSTSPLVTPSSKSAISSAKAAVANRYAHLITDGDLNVAETQLTTPKRPASHSSTFRLAFRLGTALVLTFWILWDTTIDSSNNVNLFTDPVINIFTATVSYTLLYALYGANCMVWEKHGVNHNYVLSFPIKATNLGRTVVSHGLVM